jgi:hypothetical protein
MTAAQRRAYLDAMGIDVWLERQAEPVWDRLVLGPGAGSTLLVCNDPEDAASALAADIVRAPRPWRPTLSGPLAASRFGAGPIEARQATSHVWRRSSDRN